MTQHHPPPVPERVLPVDKPFHSLCLPPDRYQLRALAPSRPSILSTGLFVSAPRAVLQTLRCVNENPHFVDKHSITIDRRVFSRLFVAKAPSDTMSNPS